MSDIDTIRWGDTQSLVFTPTAGELPQLFSKQLLRAHWQRPLTWKVLVAIQPHLDPTEVATIAVILSLTVGCGGGMVTIPLTFSFAPPYLPVVDFFDIPAQDIQAQFQVVVGASVVNVPESVTVSIMAAPFTEPGAITQVRDHMQANPHGIHEPDHEGLPRWMPRGFEDGETRYRP